MCFHYSVQQLQNNLFSNFGFNGSYYKNNHGRKMYCFSAQAYFFLSLKRVLNHKLLTCAFSKNIFGDPKDFINVFVTSVLDARV